MKVNFQETIKQKTDEELGIISKDSVFHSDEERLMALNELDLRNNPTEELSTTKKEIASSEETPIITEQALKAVQSTKRIYKIKAVWAGSFLGGPLVAGYLIAENFKTFNETGKAKKTWIYTIVGTVLIFGFAFLIPEDVEMPNWFIPLLYTLIAYFFAKHFQGQNISAYISLGGKTFGWWRIILISLIGVSITLILFFVFGSLSLGK